MSWQHRIALLWAGLVIGGSLIAAPAKFQVEALTMPVALQVGRAQFLGVTVAELGCLATILVLFFVNRRSWNKLHVFCITLVVVAFAAQHLALMPILQARSERIIAGETVGESSLHLIYVVLEVLKVIALLVSGSSRIAASNDQTKSFG